MKDINASVVTILGDTYDLEIKVNEDSATIPTRTQVMQHLMTFGAHGVLVKAEEGFVYIPSHQIMRMELEEDR